MGTFLSLTLLFFYLVPGTASTATTDTSVTVHFYDVGQGDLTVFAHSSHCLIVDAGGERPWPWPLRRNLIQQCPGTNTLILTHFDRDHILNAMLLHRLIKIENVFTPHRKPHNQSGRKLIEAMHQKRKRIRTLHAEEILKFPWGKALVLWPQSQRSLKMENQKSVVLLVKANGVRLLLTGDADQIVEKNLPETPVDVLKVGHHGSRTSSSVGFLKRIKPKTCVISAGRLSAYGHPHKQTLERLFRAQCAVVGTPQWGHIQMNL